VTTYFVTVGPNEYKVDISNDQFLVNGQPMDLKLRQLNEQGLFLLQKGNRKLEMLLHAKDRNQVAVSVNRRHVVVQVEKNESAKGRSSANASEGSLSAPMPGTVIQILVQEGQMVEKGDVVATLESMKMQMEIKAPFAGKVLKIGVRAGQKIEKGIELVKIAK
jgi:biotin carboxyl carrier protein